FDLASENVLGRDRLAVVLRVGLVPGGDYRALQRNAGKKSLADTISICGRLQRHVPLGGTPDRTDRCAEVGSKGNIAALRECVNSFLSVEDNHKLSDLHPSLKADSYPSRTDCRRSAPTLCGSRDDNAAAASGTADEPGFRNGQDRYTFCASQNVIGKDRKSVV